MELCTKDFSPDEAFGAAAGHESAIRTTAAQLESKQSASWNESTMKSPARVELQSLQGMLAKLIQQNEDLKTMVLAQRDPRFVCSTLYLLHEFRLEVHGSASTALMVRVETEILQTKQ